MAINSSYQQHGHQRFNDYTLCIPDRSNLVILFKNNYIFNFSVRPAVNL